MQRPYCKERDLLAAVTWHVVPTTQLDPSAVIGDKLHSEQYCKQGCRVGCSQHVLTSQLFQRNFIMVWLLTHHSKAYANRCGTRKGRNRTWERVHSAMTHVVIFGQFACCVVHSTIASKRSKAKRPTNRRPLLCGKGVHSEYSSRLPIVVRNACVPMLTTLPAICLPSLYWKHAFLCVSHSPIRYYPNKMELGSQFSNSPHARMHARIQQ